MPMWGRDGSLKLLSVGKKGWIRYQEPIRTHDITLGQSWEESNHAYQEEERHKKGSVNVRRGEQRGLRVQRNRFDKLVKQ